MIRTRKSTKRIVCRRRKCADYRHLVGYLRYLIKSHTATSVVRHMRASLAQFS